MPEFAIGHELKPGKRNGLKKFASKSEAWYVPYTQLLQNLGVTRQIWYLVPRWPIPGVPDRVIIYSQSTSTTVVQDFCGLLSGLNPPAIALDCQRTCKDGTSSTEWQPPAPTDNYEIVFDWTR